MQPNDSLRIEDRIDKCHSCCAYCFARQPAPMPRAADVYDAAVAHAGRSAADLKRDALDHPAEILRLSGIKPGMRVADVLAGDGYYSELASYVVGPKGKVFMINNAAFDHWSEPAAGAPGSRTAWPMSSIRPSISII